MTITPQQAQALDTVLGDPALIERLQAMVASREKSARQTKPATAYERLKQIAPITPAAKQPAPAAKPKSAYDRLKAIAERPAGQVKTKAAATSDLDQAGAAMMDAYIQQRATEVANSAAQQNCQMTTSYYNKIRTQHLVQGDIAGVQAADEKYDVDSIGDDLADLPAKTFGFASKGY